MARQANVNVRTIRRDLRFFAEAGIPLRESVGARSKKAWRIDQRGSKVIATRARDEVLALHVAIELLRPLADAQFYDALVRCADQLPGELPDPLRHEVQQMVRHSGLSLDCLASKVCGLDKTWGVLLGSAARPAS